jgi:hypothetical protein
MTALHNVILPLTHCSPSNNRTCVFLEESGSSGRKHQLECNSGNSTGQEGAGVLKNGDFPMS